MRISSDVRCPGAASFLPVFYKSLETLPIYLQYVGVTGKGDCVNFKCDYHHVDDETYICEVGSGTLIIYMQISEIGGS